MKCYIMRGVPGSGKDHWIKENLAEVKIVSADHYFLTEDGKYVFDPLRLASAHNSCLISFIQACRNRGDPIAVSNTNIRVYEIAPYYRIAEAYGYEVEIIHVVAPLDVCKSRNLHGVPPQKIDEMYKGMEALPPWWNVRLVING